MSKAPRKKPPEKGRAAPLHVAMIAAEAAPFAKSGGLADMVSGLSLALERLRIRVSLVMPAYRSFLKGDFPREHFGEFSVPVAERREAATVLKARLGKNISVYLVRADNYFDREYLYGTPEGDYPDNAERFAFFTRAALRLLCETQPHIIHCHDWHAALAPVFLSTRPEEYPEISSVKTVLTIHNLGYQGIFAREDWHLLNLDPALFSPRHLEFYGKINFLKGGLVFADKLTTVSPSYAEEIKTREQGHGLEGVLQHRSRDLVGILNGVDYEQWNPETDRFLARNYGAQGISGKAVCKSDLQRTFGLPQSRDTALVGIVSRLASQKGFDLLEKALEEMAAHRLQLVILGSGDRRYEELLTTAARRHPKKLRVRIEFDEALAHRVEGGADLFLMPSLYEPCGLNQMYSLKYGTVPIVRSVGGLKDTVRDYNLNPRRGNGFVFGPYEPPALLDAVTRALKLYGRKREWRTLAKRIMTADFSWRRSAGAYKRVYRELLAGADESPGAKRSNGQTGRRMEAPEP